MNIKKIGLSALAGSLVAVSANAGEMSVAGSASLGLEHTKVVLQVLEKHSLWVTS